jgi:hypothetical protein
MSDFTIDDIAKALADRPLAVGDVIAKLGATCRTGVWHPDFVAALNFGLHYNRFRFQPDGCSWEHNETCVLEVTQ